jgi:hypothetical protein
VQFGAIYLGGLEACLVLFIRNFGDCGLVEWTRVLMMHALLRRADWPQEQAGSHENPGRWSLNCPELSWKSTTYKCIPWAVKRRKSHSADAATTRRGQAEGRQGNDGQRNVWQGNKTKRFSSHASADHSLAKFLRKRLILADGRTKQTLGRDRTRDRIRHFALSPSQFPKALFQRARRVSAITPVIYHALLGLQMENNERGEFRF